jgi:formylglycine-generating enzyme required for sulfatase activity
MAWIEPGIFAMGSSNREAGHQSDEVQCRVRITKGYWLGAYEVTQEQWQAVMGNNPSYFTRAGLNAPVEQVSWNEAVEFCRKLTLAERQAGRLPDGYEYNLPTEAQWEYACRAGTSAPYGGTGNIDSMGWYAGNSGMTTHPVGQKQANAWGLYDMHGNVFEWCNDWYGTYPPRVASDPTGDATGISKVDRGGSWGLGPENCRSACRNGLRPVNRFNFIGFRLALCPVRQDASQSRRGRT